MRISSLSPTRQITTKDVALAAGVNRASVSVVLNGARSNSGVSDETRRRITEVAEQLGYKRNGSAANMARGKFGCVGLLLSTKPNVSTLPPALWEGAHDELAEHNIHLSMFRVPDEELTSPTWMPKVLREWMADGLIVDYTHEAPAHLARALESNELPAVWFNTLRDFDCVRPDDYGAGQLAAQHLLELGHRRIAYLDFSHPEADHANFGADSSFHYSSFHRYRAICDEMKKFGQQPLLCARRAGDTDESIEERRFGYALELLERDKPTAIIAYGRSEVALLAARDLGLSVPEDLSIVNFGHPNSRPLERKVTCVSPPDTECGRELVRQLLAKIQNPSAQTPVKTLPFVLHPRETSAPAPTL